MKILAIETSCDETAICILECSGDLQKPEFKVVANTLLSQIELHKEYGGVFPMLAKREHEKNLPIILDTVLKEAGLDSEAPDIDLIAVTVGPGLEPALWTGIVFAEELGKKWQKPVLGVNHMEGHIVSVLYSKDTASGEEVTKTITFPALALLVSGGHTEIVHVEEFGKYRVAGKTRDDAVGEAFDKVARLLDLPYPGGPKVSALAAIARGRGTASEFIFPRPMLTSGDLDFSFSGLKTSLLYKTKELLTTMESLDEHTKEELARGFEDAAVDVLLKKLELALERFAAETIILGGGVSANTYLREKLQNLTDKRGFALEMPIQSLTGDNAIMIGMAAYVQTVAHPDLLTHSQSLPALRAQGTLSL